MPKIIYIQDFSYYTDQQLWQGSRLGDKLLFGELYKRHVVALANHAFRILKDEEQAKDLVQDVFLYINQRKFELPEDINIGAYLAVSVKNRCLNKLRDNKLRERHYTVLKKAAESETSHAGAIELTMELKQDAINLPFNLRTAFFMRHRDRKSNEEIGESLGVSARTVEKYLSHAMSLIKQNLVKRNVH